METLFYLAIVGVGLYILIGVCFWIFGIVFSVADGCSGESGGCLSFVIAAIAVILFLAWIF